MNLESANRHNSVDFTERHEPEQSPDVIVGDKAAVNGVPHAVDQLLFSEAILNSRIGRVITLSRYLARTHFAGCLKSAENQACDILAIRRVRVRGACIWVRANSKSNVEV